MAVDISLLSRGTRLERIEFALDEQYIRRYLEVITGNSEGSVVRRSIPPHGIATRAILALLNYLSLPPGTVHVSQSITSHTEAMFGDKLTMLTTVTQTRVLRMYMHISLGFDIYDNSETGRLLVQGDTVVMVPLEQDR